MRTALFAAGWLAPATLASAMPSLEGVSPALSFDKRQDTSLNVLGGKILLADVYAGIAGINQQIYQATQKPDQWKKCNPLNISVRREWATFSTSEKKNYITAVKCLSKLPPKSPKSYCPGCQNRYDDFVGTHIKQTFSIHNTGNFLAWHRWFTWAYEQTLRNECGYKGQQPYYNWPRWADDPSKSPALDGSDTSMSGNGVLGCTNQTYYGIPTNAEPKIKVPHGTGGGCVASGPFKDWPVNLGPVFTDLTCTPPNPITNFTDPNVGLGYNPRCLKRDISPWVSSQWSTDEQVVKLLNSPDIKTFWYDMQGGENAFTNNFMGVHTAGHFTIGGDPGSDFFTSPGDPWFYFHHAQIDRAWWTWQNLNPSDRTNAIYGTTFIANPSAPESKLTDSMNLGYAYPGTITVGDAMTTMGGPFCYTYI
ncbi:Di-copper centre-containing protein [Cucurbitaria berberidis CBS 394.84]|uniref:Di-copper centre-containing protein n=1 Tax=Cucurbitaria berberidis CBS 394.84 TaxID=1168544 RepID=A0A9P4L9U8_9PLEO|nr:Di-copper centre-containing protein [Cucurbitaria berberidis CBS 394.84]KAF1846574.1 Di-copper centre-containing protein [Cucurbitaria berberidis CBS 394.84]